MPSSVYYPYLHYPRPIFLPYDHDEDVSLSLSRRFISRFRRKRTKSSILYKSVLSFIVLSRARIVRERERVHEIRLCESIKTVTDCATLCYTFRRLRFNV